MDHLERIGSLRRNLVSAVLIAAIVATSCIADDESTASLRDVDADRPLPSITTGSDPSPSSDSSADSANEEVVTETTPTSATTTTAPPSPLQGLGADPVASGFDQPILVASVPGTDALVVVEREGIVKVVADGEVAAEPFLDLRDRLLSSSIEQGLLGLVFHPDYESNRRVFAYWTDTEGDSVLAEFSASGADPVDVATERIVLQVEQPAERHNAGHLAFGPDGYLYVAIGDGGSGGTTGQDTSNLLGSILRLDVSEPGRYQVPPGNPFDDEIWYYGLRNPWRFSIDATDGLIYIGDVGQEAFEEINIVAIDAGGTNFGWFEMEGDECFRSACDPSLYQPPVLQYSHAEGCSVTGGYVYRGAEIPEFAGHYFFADWCLGFVRSFRLNGGNAVDQFDHSADLASLGQVTSFGLDRDGELLAVNWDGELYRIVPIR